jgi:glutathione synthase/RimK-type ligase-like ATP-grasp enzyme
MLPSFGMDSAGRTSARAFTAIWDRLKPIAAHSMSQRGQYIVRERLAAIRSLQWLHEGVARLMNSPLATEKARSKLHQLRVAARCGFRIPRTYAGNNPDEILRFIDTCDNGAVAKTATWFYGAGGRFSFTRLVTRSTVASSRAAAAYGPLIYQEYVPKAFDLRVTCVGADMFAARILSQQTSGARIDWRRVQFDLPTQGHACH